ncbi:MAG: 8-oxoguanine deaminase [candidate division KSB1 bacterium]|nr:8-oxoguanine deaminase [candidate division KSB1 bacterium]MDZ7336112.1 8-oxoguanine deaminase [candidate division KSB1 bacterium]MDZ7358912.1 8-oxoguanine deaminase [candidate division KSB1 bacterium]MDZ7399701.1 8-oxoguanine deaminase [candidate division KSB1 bacterium]
MSKILLKNCFHLVTMNAERQRFSGYDLLIVENRIEQIAKGISAKEAEVIDCSTKLVIPGLVNSHHHLCQTLTRNLPQVQNKPLFDWLVTLYEIWKYLDEDCIYYSTLMGCGELLKTGCTTTTDHHYLYPRHLQMDIPAIQFEAAERVGIRFCPTRGSMSRSRKDGGLPPESVVQDEDEILRHSEEVVQKYHDPRPLAMRQIHLGPCAPFNVTPHLMRETAALARQHGVRLHTHLAETRDEDAYCQQVYGKRPLQLMEELDWLGPDVWYAHGIHFTDAELKLLAETGTGVAHCPASNMRLGSGIARIPEMLKLGIPVGLAVDGSASNDSSDMVGEMRQALLLHRVHAGPNAMTAEQVLEMATLGSARLLGRSDIGSLEAGKAADIAVFELNKLEYTGSLADPLAALIFSGINHEADFTIVNGKIVVEHGRLVGVDEKEIIANGNRLAFGLLQRAAQESK